MGSSFERANKKAALLKAAASIPLLAIFLSRQSGPGWQDKETLFFPLPKSLPCAILFKLSKCPGRQAVVFDPTGRDKRWENSVKFAKRA